jgi:hypothetical protein
MIIREPDPLDIQPVPPGVRVHVDVSDATGVFVLGIITLTLVVILGIVVVRLSGRRSA